VADFSNSVLGVSGASGYVGRAVISNLKARGAKKIVALTRDPGKLADIEGVEVRAADFYEPETLDLAFKCSSAPPTSASACRIRLRR
jgi:NAD(P)H dehydrogenase (quinone)